MKVKVFVSTIALLIVSFSTFADETMIDAMVYQTMPMEIRYGSSNGGSVSTSQFAFAFYAAAPRWLRANRLEFGFGAISRAEESRPFFSLGPVWRWVPSTVGRRWFVEYGFSPTVLGGAKFHDKDLGGSLQFTSSLALGRRIGYHGASTFALRIQHISNGGLNSTNPGIDTIGLSFAYRPIGRRRQ